MTRTNGGVTFSQASAFPIVALAKAQPSRLARLDPIRRRVTLQKTPNRNPFRFYELSKSRARACTRLRFNSRVGIREPLNRTTAPAGTRGPAALHTCVGDARTHARINTYVNTPSDGCPLSPVPPRWTSKTKLDRFDARWIERAREVGGGGGGRGRRWTAKDRATRLERSEEGIRLPINHINKLHRLATGCTHPIQRRIRLFLPPPCAAAILAEYAYSSPRASSRRASLRLTTT